MQVRFSHIRTSMFIYDLSGGIVDKIFKNRKFEEKSKCLILYLAKIKMEAEKCRNSEPWKYNKRLKLKRPT